METAQLKAKLHEYIDHADEPILKIVWELFQKNDQAVYAFAKEHPNRTAEEDPALYLKEARHVSDVPDDFFTRSELDEMAAEDEQYATGTKRGYTWEEAKAIITREKERE
jgi:hypothetical protein